MYINFPRKTFPMYLKRFIETDKHYALFFKDNVQDTYAISVKAEPINNYCGLPVLKVIDLNTLENLEPDFVWKLFEQTLKELDVAEDF